MNCIFIPNPHEGKRFICKICGFQTNYENVSKNCRKPSLVKRATNLTKATVKHVKTGMHHCTQEERDARLEICKKCDRYVDNICMHDDCGCAIRSTGKFLDKLSWASSACPEGHWGPITPEKGV